ncbi:MAG: glycerol-3-phosphate 1-O-acyltransferase PlsY [Alistipes sp.]|nr:glycerol-3-phosphate 1-O-acyltransferase PlsY [Alistipes sp.]
MIYTIVTLVIVAYLLGSIPSAVWIGKHFYGVDIRQHGSRNAGTTNMLRVLGRRAALPVFVIDFLKGYVAVTLCNLAEFLPQFLPGGEFGPGGIYVVKVGLVVAVVLGHIFPLFAGFKGGKGVATLAGAVMGVAPASVMLCLGVWVVVLMVWHYVSLASIFAGVCFPIFIMLNPRTNTSLTLIIFSCVVAILLLITHRKNIARLRSGKESKIYIWRQPPRKFTDPPKE